jgi:Zn-dependent protease
MRSTWLLADWRGIPIFLHWTVLIGIPWFLYERRDVFDAALAFAAFCGLMLVHELGHAAVALWRGVDVFKIQLLLLHGYCEHDQPYYEADDVLIAWGGVAAQAVVLFAAWIADALFAPSAYGATDALLGVLIEANLVILVINLIPVPPLDGAKAWRILPLLFVRTTRTPLAMRLRALFARRARARDS